MDPATGEKKRADITRKHQADLREAVKEFQMRVDLGLGLKDAKVSVDTWVKEWQRGRLRQSDRKESTKELHRTLSNSHIYGSSIGGMALADVRPLHLTRLFGELTEKGLSASTRRNIYAVAKALFDDAVADGLLARTPMATVKRPKAQRVEAKYMTPEQVALVLRALADSRFFTPIALAALTGMRRGEVLALCWDDIDFDRALLRVRGTLNRVGGQLVLTEPKTPSARRDIPLMPEGIELLRKVRSEQAQQRLLLGPRWHDSEFVFTTDHGTPLDGRNMLRAFQVACEKEGIEGMGIHALRHFAATTMLDAKVPVLVVSRMLGHSSVAITSDVYGHVVDETAKSAMQAISRVVTV